MTAELNQATKIRRKTCDCASVAAAKKTAVSARKSQIEGRVGELLHLSHGDHAADVEDDEQREQGSNRPRDAQAEQRPHGDEAGHVKLVGRRLVDDEAGQEHAEEDRPRGDQGNQLRIDRRRRERRCRQSAQ
jgi:hypothetical protein